MKNIFKILFSLILFIGVFSCEKEDISPNCDMDDHENYEISTRSSGDPSVTTDCVTDPDEDEDFDGVDLIDNVTDPDEDEDFDSEEIPGSQN